MTLGLIIFTVASFGLCFYAYWLLYQITLAAWGNKKAKPNWLALVGSPVGQFLLPVYKWLLPSAGVIFVIAVVFNLLRSAYAT